MTFRGLTRKGRAEATEVDARDRKGPEWRGLSSGAGPGVRAGVSDPCHHRAPMTLPM